MCTVTWLTRDGGYELFCNRDEKLTRGRGLGPRLWYRDGVRFLAPVDGDSGGTWIGVNEHGLAMSLLNGENPRGAASRSRGMVIPALMSARSVRDAVQAAAADDWSAYSAFTLLVLQTDEPASVIRWDGGERRIYTEAWDLMPLTSSSFDPQGVAFQRQQEFARLSPTESAALHRFHASHHSEPGPYSVCMHREDARTVSFSHVKVSRAGAEFHYLPDSPCGRSQGINRIERRMFWRNDSIAA
jgi:Transport and Golgi organisation 2